MDAHGLFTENRWTDRQTYINVRTDVVIYLTIGNSYKVVRHHVEKDNKYNIYFAYTYSKMLYSIDVYESACNEHLKKTSSINKIDH